MEELPNGYKPQQVAAWFPQVHYLDQSALAKQRYRDFMMDDLEASALPSKILQHGAADVEGSLAE